MGNYNPSSPIILGQEWPGIRDEDLTFSPTVNAVEIGHGFTLGQSRLIGDARFYTRENPEFLGQVWLAAVYPQGMEDLTGPIQRVLIPCSSGSTTGTGFNQLGNTIPENLFDSSDDRRMFVDGTQVNSGMSLFFATNAYSGQLTGKRILGVNFLYRANGVFGQDACEVEVSIRDDFTSGIARYGFLSGSTPPDNIGPVNRIKFGEIAHFWSTNTPQTTSEKVPWRYQELQRLDPAATPGTRLHLQLLIFTALPFTGTISYGALEVIYCEEQRLITAGRSFGSRTTEMIPYGVQTNVMPARLLATLAANPPLTAGAYSTTLATADVGDWEFFETPVINGEYPVLNAVREMYAIPSHPGVQVNHPFPVEDSIEQVFTQQTTHILPQISLHTTGTGAPVPEVHVYGRRAVAPIYASITASQEVNDDRAAGQYAQARFWARRFGDTVVPLTFECVAPTAAQVSTSVADFDLLDEILDGWRRVDVRFASPIPISPTGGNATFRWTATGENVGNRWEILAVTAPATSGVPGNLLNEVPAAQRLGAATYDPPNGTTIALTYLAPNGSAAALDPATDAVLLISQDPPPVSGFGVTILSQTITGIGLQCGSPPWCIPTGIGYHRLTWSPTTMTVTGFGATEIQRYDSVDGVWSTIMHATSPYVTGYNDYEARIGIPSRYRIRVCNLYDFCAPWSAELASTLPAPGVFGTSCTNGVLTFTSNGSQSGRYNLAHVMQWEDTPVEDFDFPEAGQAALVEQYQRDFVLALHPTERGGERFSRLLLVNAAAISLPSLADFTRLRDMAWADLPYVAVRDELGNRWYATVGVPAGQVFDDRQVYLAAVQIVQTTVTPFPVDPASAP